MLRHRVQHSSAGGVFSRNSARSNRANVSVRTSRNSTVYASSPEALGNYSIIYVDGQNPALPIIRNIP